MTANNSYISDADNYSELFEYLEKKHVYELLALQESEFQDDISQTLSADQTSRLNSALNWGRSLIDTTLREFYQVSDLTHADAPEVIKDLNARLAQHTLERRRYRQGQPCSETMEELRRELEVLAEEGSPYSLPWTRKGGIALGTESKATQFDKSGQFDNIIPASDAGVTWPDRRNE